MFGENNSKAVDEKVDLLRNVLYKKYKEDELTEGSEEEITKVTEDNFKKCINEAFEKLLKEQEYLLDSTETLPEGCITKDLCVLSMTLPNLIINSESLHDGIHNDIKSAIIVTLLRQLQNSIVFESVMYNDRKIQEKFIRLVKSNNIDGNTFIGNRDIFWTEDDKYLLKEFVDDMEKITYSFGYNQMFIMDRSAYYFNISNISVEFEDLNEEEIESQCIKDEDGKLMYNVTNDIYIPFEKEELTEHIHRIIKKVKINATVTYKITKNKVGAGIEIKVDD